jgi:hypothetical protein
MLYQPGPADLNAFDAASSHHAEQVFNVVLELFGSLFCGDELIQIRHNIIHSEKGWRAKAHSLMALLSVYTVPPRGFELLFSSENNTIVLMSSVFVGNRDSKYRFS